MLSSHCFLETKRLCCDFCQWDLLYVWQHKNWLTQPMNQSSISTNHRIRCQCCFMLCGGSGGKNSRLFVLLFECLNSFCETGVFERSFRHTIYIFSCFQSVISPNSRQNIMRRMKIKQPYLTICDSSLKKIFSHISNGDTHGVKYWWINLTV